MPNRLPIPPSFRRRKKPDAGNKPAEKPATGKLSPEDAKKLLDTSAQTNRNLFLAFNLLLATALILCLGISDEHLLLGTSTVKVPFISVDLPIWAFASVMPLMVLALHFDLLHNLTEHSRKLQMWVVAWEEKYAAATPAAGEGNPPAQNDEDKALSDQLFPFIYDFAWLHANGKGPKQGSEKLLPNLCWMMYCWAPFTILAIFLMRFADLQSYFYTPWHLLLLVIEMIWLKKFWPGFGAKQKRQWLRGGLTFVSVGALLWTLVLYVMIQAHVAFGTTRSWIDICIQIEDKLRGPVGIPLVPRLYLANFRIRLDANHFQLDEVTKAESNKAKLWPNSPSPLNLNERRLAFANFANAEMPRVNFNQAVMVGADLSLAHLQGANLREAQLQGANLRAAQLQGAYLIFARLQGAYLISAQLQGAYLSSAQLQSTYLLGAKLQGAETAGLAMYEAVLPATEELVKTEGEIDWQNIWDLPDYLKSEEFLALPQNVQTRITEGFAFAQKHGAAVPVSVVQDASQFKAAWFSVLCNSEPTAKQMLSRSEYRPLPKSITKAEIANWMQSHPVCQPYLPLLEKLR